MQVHIDQVNHNLEFHGCIVEKYPEKFYDWKITVLFYAAIHCLKALASKRNVNIGHSHKEIFHNINPKNTQRVIQIPNQVFTTYSTLYRYSRTARYNGITDIGTYEKLKALDYAHCKAIFDKFKAYIIKQGIPVTESISLSDYNDLSKPTNLSQIE